ncbi:MAG: heme-binding domain-containing protein [Ignavibacteria bacterium]
MKKKIKFILIGLVVLFVLIQLYRPERISTNEISPDHITNKITVPANVRSILERSCYDCHSNHTKWPWYSNVAPVSWLVIDDVKEGRSKMNFSEWGKLSPAKQELRLENICEEITEGKMPLPNYLLIHKEAELTQSDKDILCKWSQSMADSLSSK